MRLKGVMEDPIDSGPRCDNLNLGERDFMSKKYTAGPWKIEKIHNDTSQWCEVEICRTNRGDVTRMRQIAKTFGFEDETIGNAQLIAAAPEMLEMLKKAMTTLKNQANGGLAYKPLINEIMKVITKAEDRNNE